MAQTSTIEANKRKFIELASQHFAQHQGDLGSGEAFWQSLRGLCQEHQLDEAFLNQMHLARDEEHYGTYKLIFKPEPTPEDPSPQESHFRFKRNDAYGGPKVENLIEKAESLVKAARALIIESSLSAADKQAQLKQLSEMRDTFIAQINHQAYLDPSLMSRVERHNKAAHDHFTAQYAAGRQHLEALRSALVDNFESALNPSQQVFKSPEEKQSALSKVLYNKEVLLHCKQQPEMVSVRLETLPNSLKDEQQGQTQYVMVDVTTPANKERTLSSGKKDDVGISNWYQSTSMILSEKGEVLHESSNSRSASIVPHEILMSNGPMAFEITKYNVLHEILPSLLEKKLAENRNLPEPITLEFVMQTLLTPLSSLLDKTKALDPDYYQVQAIRDALNYYQGRELSITASNGQAYKVQLDAVYLNSPVNTFRGLIKTTMEQQINARGVNELTDKALVKLKSTAMSDEEKTFAHALEKALNPKKDLKKIVHLHARNERLSQMLEKVYALQDELSLTSQEQAQWFDLMKKSKEKPLDAQQSALLAQLQAKRESLEQQLKNPSEDLKRSYYEFCKEHKQIPAVPITLRSMGSGLEDMRYHNHRALFKIRSKAMQSKALSLQKHLEGVTNPEFKAAGQSFLEYYKSHQMALEHSKGRIFRLKRKAKKDPSEVVSKNRLNYTQSKYSRQLTDFIGASYHKTCKSGKDRTNTAEEMDAAFNLLKVHNKEVPRIHAHADEVFTAEVKVYEHGYMHGNGNYVCANSLAVGLQQVDKLDVPTQIDPGPMKTISGLQKGGSKPLKKSSLEQLKRRASTDMDKPSQENSELGTRMVRTRSLLETLIYRVESKRLALSNQPNPDTATIKRLAHKINDIDSLIQKTYRLEVVSQHADDARALALFNEIKKQTQDVVVWVKENKSLVAAVAPQEASVAQEQARTTQPDANPLEGPSKGAPIKRLYHHLKDKAQSAKSLKEIANPDGPQATAEAPKENKGTSRPRSGK